MTRMYVRKHWLTAVDVAVNIEPVLCCLAELPHKEVVVTMASKNHMVTVL